MSQIQEHASKIKYETIHEDKIKQLLLTTIN